MEVLKGAPSLGPETISFDAAAENAVILWKSTSKLLFWLDYFSKVRLSPTCAPRVSKFGMRVAQGAAIST